MKAKEKNSNLISLLLSFQKNPYYFFDQIKPDNLENIVNLRLGFKRIYFCYHPDQAKHIIQDNKKNYPKSSLVLRKILPLSGPKGLIQLSDRDALSIRKAAGRLMVPNRMLELSDIVKNFVTEEFEKFDKVAKKKEVMDLKPFLTRLVLRTAGVFILGGDVHTKADTLNEAFVELNRLAGESLRSLVPFKHTLKNKHYIQIIHNELDKIILDLSKVDNGSFLHELLKKDLPLSFVRDQVQAFMFAGYDTTASSLIFAIDSIARNPLVQDKINSESKQNYQKALYTQAAYKESLRLYPSAYFLPKEIAEDDYIMGQKVKKGSQVFISIRHIHRNPDVFNEPNNFKPERFLKDIPHSHGFIPFGGGPRICIGASLAIMEATTALQTLCNRYKIFAADKKPPEIEGLITAHTKSPLIIKLERRN